MISSRHILVGSSTLAALLIVATVGWVAHQEHRRHELERGIADKQSATVMIERSRSGAVDANQKVIDLRDAMSGFESRLTRAGEMDKVLENIWRLARINSLQTKSIKTPATPHLGAYREQDMEVSLVGDFN